MALVFEQRSHSVLAHTGADLRAFAGHVLGWPGRVVRHRRLLNEMALMSAHDLKDIGLTHSDIADAAAMPRAQDPSFLLRCRRWERRASR